MLKEIYNGNYKNVLKEITDFAEMYDSIDIDSKAYSHFYNKKNCVMVLFNRSEFVVGIPKELDLDELHSDGYKIIICIGDKHTCFHDVKEMYDVISNNVDNNKTFLELTRDFNKIFISDYFKRRLVGNCNLNGVKYAQYRDPNLMNYLLENDYCENYKGIGAIGENSLVYIDSNGDEYYRNGFYNGELDNYYKSFKSENDLIMFFIDNGYKVSIHGGDMFLFEKTIDGVRGYMFAESYLGIDKLSKLVDRIIANYTNFNVLFQVESNNEIVKEKFRQDLKSIIEKF